MSLAIDPATVTRVLLADGWHDVTDSTFGIDAYEYLDENDDLVHGGGQSGVCASGFTFRTTTGDNVSGPLTSILAVRCNRGRPT